MKSYSLRVIALASIPAFGACAEDVSGPTGPGVEIAVAPLQLTGISDACYDIAINNADGNVVTLTNICASQYGNGAGGDITYVAPCDASTDGDVDDADGVQNEVVLKPYLYGGTGENRELLTDWRNPCDTDPAEGIEGCVATFNCNENADTLIEFNLTVLRSAQQGFFDVAVNFSDIFCSAKVDCRYSNEDGSPGDWIRLVHSGSTRTATAVVAFACTDGNFVANPANASTRLYASDVTVTCGGTPYTIPVDEAGNVYTSNPTGPIAQAIVFTGAESLTVNGDNAGKLYWNTAIGFDEDGDLSTVAAPHLGAAGANCTLSFTATASEGNLDLTTNGFLSHPFLKANVPLTNGAGLLTCGQHPINGVGANAGFSTVYGSTVDSTLAWTLNAATANAGKAVSFE